jgi:hypothetical protein
MINNLFGFNSNFGKKMDDYCLGRFLSVDPLAHEFPWQSPYVAFNNNPIYFIDPTGESGIAYKTDKKNKEGKPILRVVSNIYIYGEGATPDRANMIKEEANTQYNNNGQFFTATVDGVEYEVQFEFTSKVIDAKDVDSKLVQGGYYNLNAENNFFEVLEDIETSVTLSGGVNGANTGAFKTSQIEDGSNAVSHEINHGFGGTNKDNSNIKVNQNPDIAITRDNTDNPSSRRVTQDNIDAIFKNVSFKGGDKANVGNARPFKYDKSAPGSVKQVAEQ